MGEQKEIKMKSDAGEIVTAIYKLDLHCEGCAKKYRKALMLFDGVTHASTDCPTNKLTVIGKIDPASVPQWLEKRMKKKVELVSPQPKKEAAAGEDKKADLANKPENKKADNKKSPPNNENSLVMRTEPASVRQWLQQRIKKKVEFVSQQRNKDTAGDNEKKTDTAKKPEKEKVDDNKSPPKEITLVLKIKLHCEGCIVKIRNKILQIDGVEEVIVDASKDLVTLRGTMNVKEVVPYLEHKFKRKVEVVPPKKDDAGKGKPAADGGKKEGDDKNGAAKDKPAADGGKKEGDVIDGAATAVPNKMEYYGHPPSTSSSSYWYDEHVPVQNYNVEPQHQGYVNLGYVDRGYDVAPGQYSAPQMLPGQYSTPQMLPGQYKAPQMFSDDNPNACSVM